MKAWSFFIVCILTMSAMAQDQFTVRLNEQGLVKILKMVLKYNTGNRGSRTVKLADNIYKFTLKKEKLFTYPLIKTLNEITNLNLNNDLDFFVNTSDIKINGAFNTDSIKTSLLNSDANGFDLKLNLDLSKIELKVSELSLCQDRLLQTKKCGDGLRATARNVVVRTIKRPISLEGIFRIRTNNRIARVRLLSINSNLESSSGPGLEINFDSIEVPKISIVINGQETQLDTSSLKGEILERKDYLGKKLLNFVANFVASDLEDMINKYLVNVKVATAYRVINQSRMISYDDFLEGPQYQVDIDNTYVKRPYYYSGINRTSDEAGEETFTEIADIIRQAQLDLSLKHISTPTNKDLELSGLVSFSLNNQTMRIKDTLGNMNQSLPQLRLKKNNQDDVTLAISETLINGSLDLIRSTGMIDELSSKFLTVQGFYLKDVKLHFNKSNSIDLVANAEVDLREISSKGNLLNWIKNKIAAWLERNNNNSKIYFPLQIRVNPTVRKIEKGVVLDLNVLSPFNSTDLINSYNYPSNIGDMTDVVKEGILKDLKTALAEYIDKTYSIDLKKFLNQSGVEFLPKNITVLDNAYLIVDLDITDIEFSRGTSLSSKNSR